MKILKIDEMFSTHRINEGAGAGYNVMFGDLEIDVNTIEITDPLKDSDGNGYFEWKAKLKPCNMKEWATSSYYDGTDSNSSHIEFDFDIKGGEVRGWMETSEFLGENGKFNKSYALNFLKEMDGVGFSLSDMIGGGWVHTNLSNPIEIGSGNYVEEGKVLESDYRKSHGWDKDENEYGIYYAKIDAKEFADFVNDFYKNVP